MRDSARRKGRGLVHQQYAITAVFYIFIVVVKQLQRALQFDLTVAMILIGSFCVTTYVYFILKCVRGLTSFFYAYALDARDRAISGRTLWPLLLFVLSLAMLALSWFFAAFFQKNVSAYLEQGAMRALIATNLISCVVVMVPGFMWCYLLHLWRRARRSSANG